MGDVQLCLMCLPRCKHSVVVGWDWWREYTMPAQPLVHESNDHWTSTSGNAST